MPFLSVLLEGQLLPSLEHCQLNRRHFWYITHVRADQARRQEGQAKEVMNRLS